jgi:hypothetical protein
VRKFTLTLASFLLLASVSCAQTSHVLAPSPELQKLDFFAGTWKTEGTLQVSPSVPPGPCTALDHTAWLKGGAFVVTHSDVRTQFGDGEEIEIMGYDATRKLYTYNSFSGGGHAEVATGTFDGVTWTWLSNPAVAGPMSRFTQTILSPNSFSAKLEVSMDGTNWFTYMQGTVTRQ